MRSCIKDILQKIDKDHFSLLQNIGKVAQNEKLKAYLVGGMVRDLLLGFNNLDIDIVVENNAHLLAELLVKQFPYCELSAKHDRFHTAKLVFNMNGKKIPVDLASTRQEIYEYPAALPTVRVSELKKDLFRRDFTINALAISLLPDEFGDIVDLFDGLLDLKNKKIRVLHDLSFIDDPTRIIRAIRFATKLNFEIEEYTEKLLKEAIDSKQFDNLIDKIRGDRVKIEIRYLFNLSNIEKAIEIFFSSGACRLVSTELQCDRIDLPRQVHTDVLHGRTHQWLIYLALIMKDLTPESQDQTMKNLQLTNDEMKIIKSSFVASNRLQALLKNNQTINSMVIYRELKDLAIESVLILQMLIAVDALQCNASTTFIRDLIKEYINVTSQIKLEITGQDLITMGIKEGKKIGEILDKVLEKKIKNPNMKKEDEIKEAKLNL